MMSIKRLLFTTLLFFAIFHLIRDILQNYHIENFVSTFLKLEKNWCSNYCNAITIPFELFILAGAAIVIKRDRMGLLGRLVIAVFLIWVGMFLYDYLF
jgi:hypothetical protein